ncbi:MAG: site-2 protease family protein [Oscillospiraceae bacterium]|nr:site-2 protease family protein [Oscillospiraceae bacterium]
MLSPGPIVNLFIILIAMFATLSSELRELIIYSNILILVFNLMPLYPLDGGRIIKSLLKLRRDKTNVEKAVNQMSNIVIIMLTALSSVLIIYFQNIAIFFAIMYLWAIMIKENKHYRIRKRAYDVIQKETNMVAVKNEDYLKVK